MPPVECPTNTGCGSSFAASTRTPGHALKPAGDATGGWKIRAVPREVDHPDAPWTFEDVGELEQALPQFLAEVVGETFAFEVPVDDVGHDVVELDLPRSLIEVHHSIALVGELRCTRRARDAPASERREDDCSSVP